MEGIGIGLGIFAIAISFMLIVGAAAALAAREEHSVVCPADGKEATVHCSAADGVREVFGGPGPCIAACDRWPARMGCAQGCAAQLTAPPTRESVDALRRHRDQHPPS
jgi:hypothetical protein